MTGGGSFIYNRKIIPQRRTIKSTNPNPTGDQRKAVKYSNWIVITPGIIQY